MRRFLISLMLLICLLGGIAIYPDGRAAGFAIQIDNNPAITGPDGVSAATPTPPPPPFEPTATTRPGGGGGGGGDDDPSPTRPAGGPGIVYPTLTPSPSPTLSASPTLTNTATPTATPLPNLRVVVYVDTNNNHLMEQGEGVEGLRMVVSANGWAAEQWTRGGEVWFWIPADLAAGSEVQINAPYLHQSKIFSVPRDGRQVQVDILLKAPNYPIFLP